MTRVTLWSASFIFVTRATLKQWLVSATARALPKQLQPQRGTRCESSSGIARADSWTTRSTQAKMRRAISAMVPTHQGARGQSRLSVTG